MFCELCDMFKNDNNAGTTVMEKKILIAPKQTNRRKLWQSIERN